MALVTYSDSEASDSESGNVPQTQEKQKTVSNNHPVSTTKPPPTTANAGFQALVDRSNPRKIRVALPGIKSDSQPEGLTAADEDGPARKKPRIGGGGGGGGAFAGFNALLPAPKRTGPNATAGKDKDTNSSGPARKVFSLKTGATPGFDRDADAEMRNEQIEHASQPHQVGGDNGEDEHVTTSTVAATAEEPKLKGNPMMFKPLSVARNTQKKKKTTSTSTSTRTTAAAQTAASSNQKTKVDGDGSSMPSTGAEPAEHTASSLPASAPPKPKISLFSLSSTENEAATPNETAPAPKMYQPLVYATYTDAPSAAGPQEASDHEQTIPPAQPTAPASTQSQSLDNIADDLNLSRAQRRQLFGRQPAASAKRVLTFNTDAEYAANQALAHETDLAAAQHNPVRAIAPGKHTLQQLVNAASTQREALEESFAAGRRNKKEAGSKYGW